MTPAMVTATIEERVVAERERAVLLQRQLQCECPAYCDVQHDE